MLTNEGADDAEIIVRPASGSGWRIEIPRSGGTFVAIVSSQTQAFYLARQLRPSAHIRLLPPDESPETLQDDLRRPRY